MNGQATRTSRTTASGNVRSRNSGSTPKGSGGLKLYQKIESLSEAVEKLGEKKRKEKKGDEDEGGGSLKYRWKYRSTCA